MYASELRSSVTQAVMIGLRSAGGAVISDTKIAVHRQRERPRDRGRGHVEDVGGAIVGERRALLHSEPVLLVDHGHGEVTELDVALDERVRTDGDIDVAGGEQLVDDPTVARPERAREQCDPHTQLGTEPLVS